MLATGLVKNLAVALAILAAAFVISAVIVYGQSPTQTPTTSPSPTQTPTVPTGAPRTGFGG